MSIGIVALRKVELTDVDLFVQYANNPLILANMRDNYPNPFLLEDATAFIEREVEEVIPKSFIIMHNGKFAGMIGLLSQSFSYKHSAELGFWIAEPFRNLKIAERAVKMMVNHAFIDMNLLRLFCKVFEFNKSSMRVLTNAGFVLEGISKMAIQKDNKVFDEYQYAILNEKLNHS